MGNAWKKKVENIKKSKIPPVSNSRKNVKRQRYPDKNVETHKTMT